jgi:hypothetical protein
LHPIESLSLFFGKRIYAQAIEVVLCLNNDTVERQLRVNVYKELGGAEVYVGFQKQYLYRLDILKLEEIVSQVEFELSRKDKNISPRRICGLPVDEFE